ncbi:MAG: TRAM domain-containing protein [Anaerolineae bacterium]|nr:TRAM domain-containing protein [Anaerolineae bacterium]
MSVEFVLRLIGMVVLAIVGWQLGINLAREVGSSDAEQVRYVLILSLSGAALGSLLTPWFTTKPLRWIRERIRSLPAQQLVAIMIGLVIGLVVGALLSIPLSNLPEPWDGIAPIAFTVLFAWLGVAIMVMRARDIENLLKLRRTGLSGEDKTAPKNERMILLDSSVIIDGRIADIAQTGFVQVPMVVPHFVLNEVQYIADSSDDMRRVRGRRGLEVLNRMRKNSPTPVRISDMDIEDVNNVDDKLIMLARQLHCPVMTNDFNLNRVAEIQGVQVLNINELANAVKVIYLPGETFQVRIIQQGRDPSQGVGYLDDGTMVVVQNGVNYVDKTVDVEVTRAIQTAAGRMIFADIRAR